MRTHFSAIASLAMSGVFATVISSQGQLPVARPAAITSTILKGGGGFSTIGLPFTREPLFRDVVASSSGNTITGAGGGYGDLTSTPHSVVIQTGPNRGRTERITANTANSITLAAAVAGLIANSDEFEIVPEWTFGTFFGTGSNPSGLTSSPSSGSADIVYIDDGNGTLVQYFHNGTNWRRVATPTNANNVSLGGLSGGAIVLKRSAGDLTFAVRGVLRSGRQVQPVTPAFNVVTYTEASGATLGTSGLVPGVLASNASSSLADIVYIPDGNGSLVQYFHNGSFWRRVATPTNQNGLVIRPETALVINKRSAGTTLWVIDEKYAAGPGAPVPPASPSGKDTNVRSRR